MDSCCSGRGETAGRQINRKEHVEVRRDWDEGEGCCEMNGEEPVRGVVASIGGADRC